MKPATRKRTREPDSQYTHRPKRSAPHYAREVREAEGAITPLVEEFTRRLMPWARQNALGLNPAHRATHRGWSPSIKPDRLAVGNA